MLVARPLTVRAYHGTTLDAAQQIISQREFRKSQKRWDWLGYGAYFFQDAPGRAWDWASTYSISHFGGRPAVLAVNVDLTGCLDLLDVKATEFLKNFDKLFRRNE